MRRSLRPAYFAVLNAIFSGAAATLFGVAAGVMTGFWIWNSGAVGPVVAACVTGVA